MSKQPPPAPTASAIDPNDPMIHIVGRPGTGSLPRTIAPPTKVGQEAAEDISKRELRARSTTTHSSLVQIENGTVCQETSLTLLPWKSSGRI